MAKSKNRKSTRSRNTRVANVNTSRRLRFPQFTKQLDLFDDIADVRSLSELEDRRVNYPSTSRPIQTVRANVKLLPNRSNPFYPNQVPAFLRFDVPENVIICARRKIRKQVMHAFNNSGRGGQRKPRRNNNSDIRC